MFGQYKSIKSVPDRLPLQPAAAEKQLDLVMHEYGAIRREIDSCLTNQVSVLSFGVATVGLLVAAAGSFREEEPLLSALLQLFAIPAACFLALAIHAGELVRLMRAGLFLHELENWVNKGWPARAGDEGRVLTWEQWDIRKGSADVDRHNRRAITLVFSALGLGFALSGFLDLHQQGNIDERVAVLLLVVSLGLGLATALWVTLLRRQARAYRDAYQGKDEPLAGKNEEPESSPDSASLGGYA